ncbi:MAG: bifunctional metallophosphatase/5'-nucleotidase [Planctomycetes bacterium]|nr:bifunctional metallophosphatase/5'-nucleotidase [Planctomycetota bacterium]
MSSRLSRRARLLGLALLALGQLGARPLADRTHVVLLHTNDVHGQVVARPATWLDKDAPPLIGGLPRIAAYAQRVRAECAAEGVDVLMVDAGDWTQGTPEGLIEHGRAYLRILAQVGYDALAVGNHDLDWGVPELAATLEEVKLPAVCANVRVEPGGPRVEWCAPWRVVEVGGVRVAVVGLLTPITPTITHEDAKRLGFDEPADALSAAQAALAGKADWILPVTHLGVTDDRRLAKAHPELDVIVGGHSHTYLKRGVTQGDTFIVQSGSKGSAVGRLDLWFDAETKRLDTYEYELVDLLEDHAPGEGNDAVDAACAALVAQSATFMDERVGELVEPLARGYDRLRSAPAGNLITDVMRARIPADVAIQNRGGIRCDLPAGPVTRRGLFELAPFGNHLVLLEVSGALLVDIVRASVEGTAHTGLELSGAKVLFRLEEDGAARFVGLEIGGAPVDPERTYTLVTNSFLGGGGDGYEALGEAKHLREDPTMLRDVMEAYFAEHERVTPPTDDRYERREP